MRKADAHRTWYKGLRSLTRMFAVLFLALVFQNCLGVRGTSPTDSAPRSDLSSHLPLPTPPEGGGSGMTGGGNGEAYDKIVYVTIASAQPCPDGSWLKEQVDVSGGVATQVRESCAAIPVGQRKTVPYTVDPNNQRVILVNGIALAEVDWHLSFVVSDANNNLFTYGLGGSTQSIPGVGSNNFVAVSKLDSRGKMLWSKFMPKWVTVVGGRGLPNGNFAYFGYFVDSRPPLSPQVPGPDAPPSLVFVMSPQGELVWSRSFVSGLGGPYGSGMIAMDVDSFGNTYTVGTNTDTAGVSYQFLLKLDALGNTVWIKRFSSSSSASAGVQGLRVSPVGEIFVYGSDSGAKAGYIVHLDSSGVSLSSHIYSRPPVPQSASISSLEFGSNGNLVIAGYNYDNSSYPSYRAYVATIKTDGSVLWAKAHSNSRANSAFGPIKVTVGGSGTIYTTKPSTWTVQYPNMTGDVMQLASSGMPLLEINFSTSHPPNTIESPVVIGPDRDLWMLATKTYTVASFNYARYFGLLRLQPELAVPCSLCTLNTALSSTTVTLNVGSGGPILSDIHFQLDTNLSGLQFIDSPVPIPLF